MASITIDGIKYQVEEGQNLLQACLNLGLNLPYFCWHPALGSVGACRQCALIQYQDNDDQRGRLIMGCMTPVADGQRLSINAENAVNFRAGVIEALMTNHPHDCPVCEEGGECHLQDMTVMSGHNYRHYRGLKRTFHNQQLGPFINHEMNRCITCYRCLRYYRDYAGGDDLHALASRNRTYFGRFEDGPLDSEFSGNLVEVCPTGVFTDKTFTHHYSRKWDLQCAPSVCVHCSLGCNTSPGERYGTIRRIQNRYNADVNGYFLCDRGRFGYDFVNHPQRPRTPQIKRADRFNPLDDSAAIEQFSHWLHDPKVRWLGIGSPRATLESNLALQRLVGPDHFFSGIDRRQEALNQAMLKLLRSGHAEAVSMQQTEQADAILVLGEDVTQTAPRLALSLRQAARSIGRSKAASIGIPPWQDQAVQIAAQDSLYPLYISNTHSTRLDSIARARYRAKPLEQARLGFAIAQCINDDAPMVTGLTKMQSTLARQIANDLLAARHPLVVTGSSAKCPELIDATEQILKALNQSRHRTMQEPALPWVTLVFAECNSLGLTLLNHRGQENCLNDAFDIVAQDHATQEQTTTPHSKIAVIVLENDLFKRTREADVRSFFAAVDYRVVIDYLPSQTTELADLLLPAASFAETQGVLVNNEGRAQSLFPVYPAPESIRMGWQWLQAASEGAATGSNVSQPKATSPLDSLDTAEKMLEACIAHEPMLAKLDQLINVEQQGFAGMKWARMSPRASGRTAMRAQVNVHEPKQPEDPASALAFSMEGVPAVAMAHQAGSGGMMPYSWYPGWNSNQSIHKFQHEIGGPLTGPKASIKLMLNSLSDSHEEWIEPPKKPRNKPDQLLLQPLSRIFGSDELSMQAPAVIARSTTPHIHLHPEDAKNHQIENGDLVQVSIDTHHLQLPVIIDPVQARRVALIDSQHRAMQGLFDGLDGHGDVWISLHSLGPNPVIGSDRRTTDV